VHPWYELTKHNIVRHPVEKPLMIKHDEVLNKVLKWIPKWGQMKYEIKNEDLSNFQMKAWTKC
jgi:hypothetical protein